MLYLLIRQCPYIGFLGCILADRANGIFNPSFLSDTLVVGEMDPDLECIRDSFVTCKLFLVDRGGIKNPMYTQ